MSNATWTSLIVVELVSLVLLGLGAWCYARIVEKFRYFLGLMKYDKSFRYEHPLALPILLTYVFMTLFISAISVWFFLFLYPSA